MATDDWRSELETAGELTPSVVESILRTHGDRGNKAIEAVSEERIKQYRDFTVVVGHTEEYIVEADGCTCKDVRYNLDQADPSELCWHVLAVEIAERVGAIDYHDMYYSEVRDLL